MHSRKSAFGLRVAALAAVLALWSEASSAVQLLDATFDAGRFVPGAAIDNPYWPLVPGTSFAYYSESREGCAANLVEVTNQYKADFPAPYQSVSALVVRDREWVSEECDGVYRLVEDTKDWYAQDTAGNVWYFGEASVAYDAEEECPSREGSWEAGVDGAEPGIIMLAEPRPGVAYRQEFAAGTAEDLARVLRLNATVNVGSATYAGCLVTKEWSPLEHGSIEQKYYCPAGGGLVLIREHHGRTVRVEYVGSALPDGTYAPRGTCTR